jgi:hypothetical protein
VPRTSSVAICAPSGPGARGGKDARTSVRSIGVDTGAGPGWPGHPTRRGRLLYGIGRVCEAHVVLDWTLGTLQAELAIVVNPADPEKAYRPRRTPPLTTSFITRCRKLLSESGLPEDLRVAGDDALDAAWEANKPRNRVVHDAWFERIESTAGSSFTRVVIEDLKLTDEPSDLDFVQDTEQGLVSARDCLRGLLAAMNRIRAAGGHPMPEGLSYQELIPVIRGERPFIEGA